MYNSLIVRFTVAVCIFAAFFMGVYFDEAQFVIGDTGLIPVAIVAAVIGFAWAADRLLDH